MPRPEYFELDNHDGWTLSLKRVATSASTLASGAQPVPDDLEREIARRFVRALGADR